MAEYKPVPCPKCFHFHVCENKHTPPTDHCYDFVDADCVEILMNNEQINQVTKELNAHMERLLNLKRRLDSGERTLDLYRNIINLDY